MSKSHKTPPTASWRTLMRRADAATSKTEAAKLREQAASLRRDERKAAKAPKRKLWRRLAKSVTEFNQVNAAADRAATAMESTGAQQHILTGGEAGWKAVPLPGRGEIVGGEVAKLADTLAALARKKGGTDAVQAELVRLLAVARYEGQKAAEESSAKERIATREATDERIVCGFIAEVDEAQARYRGLPADLIWTLNSHTVVKIVDALTRAGYTAKGKKK